MKTRLGPQNRLFPAPVPLVLSGTGDEASMLAVAWATIVGSKPPSLAMALGRRHHTVDLIERTGEFTVNVPPVSLAEEVDYCGLVSGRDVDKTARCGFTLLPSAVVGPPIIEECPYNLECRVSETFDMPTGTLLVVGEVLEAHADAELVRENGRDVDIARLDPLVYITGNREYFRLGERVADAYRIGRRLDEESEAEHEDG